MALRTITLAPESKPANLTPEDWRRRVDDALARARAAIVAGDAGRLAAVYADAASWENEHRSFQGTKQVTELVFGAGEGSKPGGWAPLYVIAAEALLAALDARPAEPVLLNYLGVLLYELNDVGAADALFRAAQKLDPELPHLRRNLRSVRDRKRKPVKAPFGPQLAGRVRAAGAHARRLAGAAGPTDGLRLSFCMIVKDEEEMLPGCLEAVRDGVDEMIVVDTGSTDRTVEIAESFGAKVVHFPWNGSFSDARNVSLEHCTGDWVMYLDADEHLMPGDALKLRDLVRKTWREAFYLSETNYTGADEAGSAVNHLALRLWRHRPEYRFEGRIHEQKTHNMPRFLPERYEVAPIRIRHYGYLKSRISAKDKSRRNLELLEQEARENPSPFNSFNIGSEYLNLGEWERAVEHLDRAWDEVRSLDDWRHVPYVPSLSARMVLARRGAGKLESAREGVAEALAVFPAHTDLVFELALVEKDSGNLEQAGALAEQCLRMGDAPEQYAPTVGTGTYLAQCLLADVRRSQGRAGEATALLRSALGEHPDYIGPVFPLATLLLAEGETPEAVEASVPVDKPSARLLLATALYEAGHAVEAERSFRLVLERQPTNGAARIGLLEALLSQGRFADAAGEAEAEPADSPVAGLAAVERLFALAALGDAEALAEALARAEAAGARTHELELYRGWRALLAGGAPGFVSADAAAAALVALEALLRVQEFEAFAGLLPLLDRSALPLRERRERLASMYLRRGYLESAAETWISVVDSAPDANAWIGLAQVALAGGSAEDALQFATTALELEPGSMAAARLQAAARGRLDRVIAA